MDKIQLTYKMKLRDLGKREYKTLKLVTKFSKNLYNEAIFLERSAYKELSDLNSTRENKLTNMQIVSGISIPNKPPRELSEKERIYLAWRYKLNNLSSDKANEPFSSFVNYNILDKIVLSTNYFLLYSTSSQAVLQQVDKNYLSYFRINKIQTKRPPYYLSKDEHFQVTYKTISKKNCEKEIFKVSFSSNFKNFASRKGLLTDIQIKLPDKFKDINKYKINQIKLVPKNKARYFELCIIYTTSCNKIDDLDKSQYLSIDLGLNNLMSCISTIGSPFIISGRKLKSYNQWYNKEIARLKSISDLNPSSPKITRKMSNIIQKRNNRVEDYMRKSVRLVIDYCIENKIGNIVVGYNKDFKRNINIGKKSNQNFTQIPLFKIRQKLKYLCEYYGINYKEQEESYTSKSSFLSQDSIPDYKDIPKKGTIEHIIYNSSTNKDNQTLFSGTRISRGLYKDHKQNLTLNADINGAVNILRKSTYNNEEIYNKVRKTILEYPNILQVI